MPDTKPERALRRIAADLRSLGTPFALVGGLAVTLRAEPRFTRDVDLAIVAANDGEVENLVYELRARGYSPIAIVEHEDRKRLSTVRLASPVGVVVDLLAASSGIEAEIVAHATLVAFGDLGDLPVARAEDLLAMKVLSMTEQRPQDRADATSLVLVNSELDLAAVRTRLAEITARGFHRGQDLEAKLAALLASIA